MVNARLIIPLVLALLYFGLNTLIYFRLKQWFKSKSYWKVILWAFRLSILVVVMGLFQALIRNFNPPVHPTQFANYFVGLTFSLMAGSLFFGIILLVDWFVGVPFWGVKKLQGKPTQYSPTRRKFVQATSTVLAGLPFLSLIQGITFGKYNYQVRNVKLSFPDLPKAFHGFKIVHISDIHSGSFDSKSEVAKGIDLINQQKPDLIAFTGDLVNSKSDEIEPFIDIFGKLRAKHGVVSTKGNHDYGLYYNWPNQQAHAQDQKDMETNHKRLGFELLNNSHKIIQKGNDKISIAGVENWGKAPFPQLGDLDAATKGSERAPFTVLLSHDPSHWDEEILDHKKHFHLTLSGHTHGMQFGVEIPEFKWSPVKYRYPRWAGLYEEKNQYLYVNRGFGFIGFPGRVGIMPEITVIELKQKTKSV